MRFPVDITKVQLVCGGEAEPSLVYETGEQRTNRKGEPLFQVQLMAGGDDRPVVIPVRTPVEPKGLSFGMPVRAVGLDPRAVDVTHRRRWRGQLRGRPHRAVRQAAS